MYRKTVLNNGLRVVTEDIPSFHSVSLGFSVGVGSRFEEPNEAGYSHFLEHMLFKGTPTRDSTQIAREIEAVGGILNAFTAREYTSYYAKVLHENLEGAVDLLSDIFLNSTFDIEELERERDVIKEEVRMVDDNPDDLVVDLFYQNLFPQHPLGSPILGNFETLDGLNRDKLIAYQNKWYRPDRVVIAAAGRIDHDQLVEMVSRRFDKLDGAAPRSTILPERLNRSSSFYHKPTEQVHACLGTASYGYSDPRRIPLLLLNTELGGGMGSRLFQEVREKRGLAYMVGSHCASFLDIGVLEIFLGTAKKNITESIETCVGIMSELRENGLTEKELGEAKAQLKGGLLMSLESSDSRMGRLARNELYAHEFLSTVELIEKIESVTIDDIAAVADDVFNPEHLVLTLLGDHEDLKIPAPFHIQ